MTHRNAVLTPQGRLPAGDACPGRSSYRRCSRRGRYRPRRDVQVDRSLPPERSPGARGPLQRPASPPHLDQFQDCGPHRALTSHPQGSAPRISHELAQRGTVVSVRTRNPLAGQSQPELPTRHPTPPGRPTGPANPSWPASTGRIIHLDVKKVGRIPPRGGWRAHGRARPRGQGLQRDKGARTGYTYLHTAIDGFSRLAYTEALDG